MCDAIGRATNHREATARAVPRGFLTSALRARAPMPAARKPPAPTQAAPMPPAPMRLRVRTWRRVTNRHRGQRETGRSLDLGRTARRARTARRVRALSAAAVAAGGGAAVEAAMPAKVRRTEQILRRTPDPSR